MNDLTRELGAMVAQMKAAKGNHSKTIVTTAEKIADRDAMMAERIKKADGKIPYQLTGVCDIVERCAKQRASHG